MKTDKLSSKTELGLLHIDVTVDCSQWNEVLPGAATLARKACNAVFNKVRTNVLSFATAINETPLTSLPLLLGDIIVAYETLVNEASSEDKKISDHLCHLIVHGMLHLLGFDHQALVDADIMENIEINILQKLNVENPYQVRASKDRISP
jgi:rRNA maturation RNase YbeY